MLEDVKGNMIYITGILSLHKTRCFTREFILSVVVSDLKGMYKIMSKNKHKQPNRPSIDEWVKKMWHIAYTMGYYSSIKKN